MIKLLERECRREKTLESRSKDNKANKDRLHRNNAPVVASNANGEENKPAPFLFEPPMDAQTDGSSMPHLSLDVPDDQLRVAEEHFFDIIHQVQTFLLRHALSKTYLISDSGEP